MLFAFIFRQDLAIAFKTPDQVNLLTMMLVILGLDGLSNMPFVILRKTGRPKKFAIIKIINGVINFLLVLLFIVILPKFGDHGILGFSYNNDFGIGYVFVANLVASAVTFLLLFQEIKAVSLKAFDWKLWKNMMAYSWPITIAGLAGGKMTPVPLPCTSMCATPRQASRPWTWISTPRWWTRCAASGPNSSST